MTDFRYIALGAGVQSSALLILSNRAEIARADVAIFADTQDEPAWVYAHLSRLKEWSKIPVETVSRGCLSLDIVTRYRFAAIPAFTRGADGQAVPLRRQCTREYKIDPIERKVRELMGYKKGQRVKGSAEALIGISVDEMRRMSYSRTKWTENLYPLVDLELSRRDCAAIVVDAGFFAPKKSSCVFCPFHDDGFWLDLKRNYDNEWNRAVAFDRQIRNMSMSGVRNPVYLHRTLRPLDQVEFKHEKQISFWEDCCGFCAV